MEGSRTVIYAGYIIGFPADTSETMMRDIRIIQHELPIDFLEFFILRGPRITRSWRWLVSRWTAT
jgi:hypothetical protein